MTNTKKDWFSMCENCKYALRYELDNFECRENCSEPEWNEEEECFECECYKYYDPEYEEMVAREVWADMKYDEMRDERMLG